MSNHAFLPPSGAAQWVKCALWPKMNQKYSQGASEESAEGDAAHWVLGQASPTTALRAPNDVAITADMIKGRDVWWAAYHRLLPHERIGGGVEQRVINAAIHPHVWGTPDLWVYDGQTLLVMDYKYGHDPVEVFENWQLIVYAALLLAMLDVSDLQVRIIFAIVQPRGYHRDGPVRTWEVKASDLRAQWNILRAAATKACTVEQITATPGLHCKHCPGRAHCEALQRATWLEIDEAPFSLPLELPAHAIGYELREIRRAIALLKARESGLEAQAVAHLMSGERVPFFAMQPNRPREQWTVPVHQVKALGVAFNVELTKEEPVTPQQARDAGLPAAIVDSLSQRPKGVLALVEDDTTFTRKLFHGNK